MLDKYFVPYNRAKKLKALKFKEECFGSYADVEVSTPILVKRIISDDQGGYFTLAPTFEQIFDWFREKYNLESIYRPNYNMNTYEKSYYYGISKMPNSEGNHEVLEIQDLFNDKYKTYEEAQLACLDKLIEICSSVS